MGGEKKELLLTFDIKLYKVREEKKKEGWGGTHITVLAFPVIYCRSFAMSPWLF